MIWRSRFYLVFGFFWLGVFAIGMGDDLPTPIPFTGKEDVDLWILGFSALAGPFFSILGLLNIWKIQSHQRNAKEP